MFYFYFSIAVNTNNTNNIKEYNIKYNKGNNFKVLILEIN